MKRILVKKNVPIQPINKSTEDFQIAYVDKKMV